MKLKILSTLVCALMIATVFAMVLPMSINAQAAVADEIYTFDLSDEGFVKEADSARGDVHWDSNNKNVYFNSQRYESTDERLVKELPQTFTDTSGDWELSADIKITQPGWWTHAYPIFIGDGDNDCMRWGKSQLNIVWERSNSGNHLLAWYRGTGGQLTVFMDYVANTYTTYNAKLSYELATQTLKSELFVGSTLVASGTYAIGTNPDDGFAFDEIGVAANGLIGDVPWIFPEPPVVGTTDNIALEYAPSLPVPVASIIDAGEAGIKEVEADFSVSKHSVTCTILEDGVEILTLNDGDKASFTYFDSKTYEAFYVFDKISAGKSPSVTTLKFRAVGGSSQVNHMEKFTATPEHQETSVEINDYLDQLLFAQNGRLFIFDGSASYDSDGDAITSWEWLVYDSEGILIGTLNGEVVSYLFPASGDYTVRLTVSDGALQEFVDTPVAVL